MKTKLIKVNGQSSFLDAPITVQELIRKLGLYRTEVIKGSRCDWAVIQEPFGFELPVNKTASRILGKDVRGHVMLTNQLQFAVKHTPFLYRPPKVELANSQSIIFNDRYKLLEELPSE